MKVCRTKFQGHQHGNKMSIIELNGNFLRPIESVRLSLNMIAKFHKFEVSLLRLTACEQQFSADGLGMFDSDSILEKIDSFDRRIGILNRSFAIPFLLEPILNGQNRKRNRPAIKRFRILKLLTFFFFRNPIFHKCEYLILKTQQSILLHLFIIPIGRVPLSTGSRTSAYVPIFITVFSKNCYSFSVFHKVF